jgi:hypothetical protein
MKSNGFGSWQQSIVIRAPLVSAEAIAERLAARAQLDEQDMSKASVVWTRWTVHSGDDEDVVVELWGLLAELAETAEWHIDWRASAY